MSIIGLICIHPLDVNHSYHEHHFHYFIKLSVEFTESGVLFDINFIERDVFHFQH